MSEKMKMIPTFPSFYPTANYLFLRYLNNVANIYVDCRQFKDLIHI